ncbi:MAG: glycosyltransferase family 39 protein [Patescibacteria group bacterium]
MFKAKKDNFWVMTGIIIIAVIARLYGLDLETLSLEQKISVMLSVSAGVLSVIGLYLLVKELFDEKLAALSSFLLAVSFWHVMVSKLGSKDIFTSFTLIFSFYFIWNGLKYGRIFDFFLAGLFGGAGFYTGREYFMAPLVFLLVFWNYWEYIKNDFSLSKYEQTKARVLGGFSLLLITVMTVVLPVGFYVWQNPGFILSADNFVLASTEPFAQIYGNFIWIVDKLLLINFGNGNLISWPLSIFFVIGLIKEMTHWLKRKHGHLSVAHTLIFLWLFIMPIPVLLTAGLPSVLALSIILPPIMILSAKGLWWVIEKLNRWNYIVYPHQHKDLVGLDAAPLLAMIALLLSIAVLEISKIV